MPAFRAAIFDLDGTLLDTLDDLADSANFMLQSQGYPTHPRDEYKVYVGDGVRVLMERILPEDRRLPEVIEECAAVYQRAYTERWNAKTRPYAGIPELLTELSAKDIKLAVLSNKPHGFTLQCIEHFLAPWKWSVILGMRDHVPKKPDPAGALEILDQIEVSPSECLYLGDTNTDMQTAKAAGLHAVGVLWGFRDRQELVDNGAETLLEHPQDLLKLLSGD